MPTPTSHSVPSAVPAATRTRTLFVSIARAFMLAAAALLLTWRDLAAQGGAATSLTLGDAARMAAERSGATAAARARSAQADARVRQHRADFLPSVSSSAQLGSRTFNTSALGINVPGQIGGPPAFDPRGEVQGPIHNIDLRSQFTQRLLDLPAILNWRASAVDADAARFSMSAASDGAAERGATSYLRVLRAESRIAARAADSSLSAELLDIARQQLTAGVGIALDVTRAESKLADATARLIGTRSERDLAVLQLRRELALSQDAPLTISDALEAAVEPTPLPSEDDAIRGALGRRADFKAALAQSEGARTYARAARAERLPTVSLYADHGRTGKNTDRLLGTYSYGVQISTPIFDGFRVSARNSEQQARYQEAEAIVQDTRRQVETEVRGAIVSVVSAREEVTAARAGVRLAEQEVSQARERFRAGVSGNADVITASISLNSARDLLIDALTGLHNARIALASAQGTITTLR